jgi:excisionase family DNA binding protein
MSDIPQFERLPPLLDEDKDKLLAPKEVAAKLGVHERTITGYADSGEIPAIRIGPRLWRFRESQIDLYCLAIPPQRKMAFIVSFQSSRSRIECQTIVDKFRAAFENELDDSWNVVVALPSFRPTSEWQIPEGELRPKGRIFPFY